MRFASVAPAISVMVELVCVFCVQLFLILCGRETPV
jgi:hypothetical protein